MKKGIRLFLCLLVVLSCAGSALAAERLPMVVDGAGLFTDVQRDRLEADARFLGEEYRMDVVLVTVDTLDGKTPQAFADDYFDFNGYGRGDERSGVLFLLAMEERDWYISTSGDAIYALTDYGIQQLGQAMLPSLSDGAYYDAFCLYLERLPDYLDALEDGAPIDGYADSSGGYYHGQREQVVYYPEESRSPNLLVSAAVGLAAAAAAVGGMAYSMNTRRRQRGASSYIRGGSFQLNVLQDLFLYSSVSKTRKPENTGGHGGGHGGGGSSVHHSSSGRSHGGGGGKF